MKCRHAHKNLMLNAFLTRIEDLKVDEECLEHRAVGHASK